MANERIDPSYEAFMKQLDGKKDALLLRVSEYGADKVREEIFSQIPNLWQPTRQQFIEWWYKNIERDMDRAPSFYILLDTERSKIIDTVNALTAREAEAHFSLLHGNYLRKSQSVFVMVAGQGRR